jgi:SH3-like domain-containing protein
MYGQGDLHQMMRPSRRLLKSLAVALLAAASLGGAARGAPEAPERQTPSGMPVPRYVSLKFDKVNARAGPGDDHRLLWVYKARGLPLQIIAETSEWRRVCDPQGQTAWVHKRTTDGRRTVMNTQATPAELFRKPKATAKPAAYLNSRATAALDRCDKGWCKVHLDGASGWVREGALWGTSEVPQCRPAPRAVR